MNRIIHNGGKEHSASVSTLRADFFTGPAVRTCRRGYYPGARLKAVEKFGINKNSGKAPCPISAGTRDIFDFLPENRNRAIDSAENPVRSLPVNVSG